MALLHRGHQTAGVHGGNGCVAGLIGQLSGQLCRLNGHLGLYRAVRQVQAHLLHRQALGGDVHHHFPGGAHFARRRGDGGLARRHAGDHTALVHGGHRLVGAGVGHHRGFGGRFALPGELRLQHCRAAHRHLQRLIPQRDAGGLRAAGAQRQRKGCRYTKKNQRFLFHGILLLRFQVHLITFLVR